MLNRIFVTLFRLVLGKMPPGKVPPGKLAPEINPPGKLPPTPPKKSIL